MASHPPQVARFRFGPFELDPEEGTLTRNGVQVKLQDLPLRLLVMLVEHAGDVVSREEMRQHLWPGNTFVEFDNSLAVAIRKIRESLGDQAEAPRYVATVPRRGYRFVAPVSVQEAVLPVVPEALPEKPVATQARPSEARADAAQSSRGQLRYWLIAGLALLLLGSVTWSRMRARHPVVAGISPAPLHVRHSVAVLGFRNLAGREQDDWLSPVFSEMLNTELGTHGDLRMISGEDVQRAKQELPLIEDDSLARTTLERLRANPGADYVVVGSYTLMHDDAFQRIRLDLRLQDTSGGETIAEEAITGTEANLFDLAAEAGTRLRRRLGLSPNSITDSSRARVALPANQLAAELYTQGREKLWAFDFLGARDLLLKAVAADPRYPLGHSALSEAWWHLGYLSKAQAEAQQARELDALLSNEDRLLIEGQYWRAMRNWQRTVESYGALFKLFPDSLDYGLLLAAAQINTSPAQAVATLNRLRHLPPPAGDDARIDMTEASAWMGRDLLKAHAAAIMAIAKGKARGSHVIVERTYGFLCQGSVAGGGTDMADATNNCELARQSAEAAGDKNGEAVMMTNLAGLALDRGELAQSAQMLRAAIKEFDQVGNVDDAAAARNNLAANLSLAGDLKQAKSLLQEALAPYQAAEDKEGVALCLVDLGDLERQSGNLQVAETTLQQAKATAQEIENDNAVAYVLFSLGDVLTDRGDLEAARAAYEQSLALRRQLAEPSLARQTEVALALLGVETGKAKEVEAGLREVKQWFHEQKEKDDEVAASSALSRVLLAQTREREAREELDSSLPLALKSQNLVARLQAALTSARIQLAESQLQLARTTINKVAVEARQHGLTGITMEAMLLEADLEQRSAHKALAQLKLATLERMAQEKGYGLIARKAAALRS